MWLHIDRDYFTYPMYDFFKKLIEKLNIVSKTMQR